VVLFVVVWNLNFIIRMKGGLSLFLKKIISIQSNHHQSINQNEKNEANFLKTETQ